MGELDAAGASGGSQMTFELASDGDGTPLVRIAGELDMTTVEEVDAALAPILDKRPERLVVDLSGLGFADSSAIALFVKWANVVEQVEIRQPSLLLRRVISRMGLAERLRMTP
jgi:anti-anti-sigma factor